MGYREALPKMFASARKGNISALEDACEMVRMLERENSYYVTKRIGKKEYDEIVLDEGSKKLAHQFNDSIRKISASMFNKTGDSEYIGINKKALQFDAPYDFDAYCRYIEFDRDPDKQFYMPRRKQLKTAVDALQLLGDNKLRLLTISMPPGVGKALANDTPVLTRNGWKNHGDLVVGDEVVGMDGKFKRVLLVHPKCMLDRVVEFTNGEKIQCHERHEWMVYDHSRSKNNTYVAETQKLEKRVLSVGGDSVKRGHRYVLQIPNCDYVCGEHKNLAINPYLLGVWLGDGANKNPRICGARNDHAIIDKIIGLGYDVRWSTEHKTTGVMYYDFDIRKQLQKFGMCHSRKRSDKIIPQEYITASVEQRLELLAGLIDTDGTLQGNKYTFTTSEESLRDGFIELISTFHWRACVSVETARTSSTGVVARKNHYRVSFTPNCVIPCSLERKRLNNFGIQRKLAIKSISVGNPKEGNCITVEGDGMYLAGKTMIPTHNTTTAIFFLTWEAGRHPELQNLICSHNNEFLRGVYDECLRIFDKDGEYLWSNVFPTVGVCDTNAKSMRIDVGNNKRFETLEFTSKNSGNAGKVRATNILYCDDLVEGIEQAMSREQMDKLWQIYTDDFRQRKQGSFARELHIATRWSVHDPIGRLERSYGDSKDAMFITMPALDENDESNFDYPHHLGYTTQMLHEQRNVMDDASWRALYMNQPIEREGQLYPEDELRRYFSLPSGKPDAIIAVCDTKSSGDDYCFMPIVYQYGADLYIEDCVCENYAPDVVERSLIEKLAKHDVHTARFESNMAGAKVAQTVQEELKKLGKRTHITTKWTTANKETKIQVDSPFVKQHCLFKDSSVIKGASDKEYRLMISMLCGYTMAGRNRHDDVPDGLSQLARFVQEIGGETVEVVRRFW